MSLKFRIKPVGARRRKKGSEISYQARPRQTASLHLTWAPINQPLIWSWSCSLSPQELDPPPDQYDPHFQRMIWNLPPTQNRKDALWVLSWSSSLLSYEDPRLYPASSNTSITSQYHPTSQKSSRSSSQPSIPPSTPPSTPPSSYLARHPGYVSIPTPRTKPSIPIPVPPTLPTPTTFSTSVSTQPRPAHPLLDLLPAHLSDPLRIVIISTQYPYWGGAATHSYLLTQELRSILSPTSVATLFIESGASEHADPEQIGGVYGGTSSQLRSLASRSLEYLGGPPNLVLAKNYLAPRYAQQMFPDAYRVFMVSGCAYATTVAEWGESATQLMTQPIRKNLLSDPIISLEAEALTRVHQVMFNSRLTQQLFHYLYPNSISSLQISQYRPRLQFPFWSRGERRPPGWSARPYHLGFLVSHLSRQIKNPEFFLQLVHYFPETTHLLVGDGEMEGRLPSQVTHLPRQTQPEVMRLLSQVQIVVIPSWFDSNPNLAYEAGEQGCYLLVSDQTGIAELLPSEHVAPLRLPEWVQRIREI